MVLLGGVCSIQLSYWDIYFYRIILAVFRKNVKRQRQKSRDFSLPDAYNGRPERQKAEGGRAMPWWEQVGGDVDDLIFADEEYEISAR